jgi:membrane-associated protease RseP (regulator of RpoE activity)
VDGVAGLFHVDTGSRGSLTLTESFVADHGLAGKYGSKVETVYGAGIAGPMRATLARVRSLELGEVVMKDPVTMLSLRDTGSLADPELAGNVGNALLRQFNITFDFPGSVLYFEKNASYGKPEPYDRAGVWLERGDKGFEVIDVAQGGPAAEAGLKAGDVVVAVNGRTWTAMPLSAVRAELSAAPGRQVRLTVAGGGTRAVTLRDLI